MLAIPLARGNRLLPRVPAGDVVVAFDAAGRGSLRASDAMVALDTALRRWPVVCSALLLVVLVLATALLTRW